MCFWENIKSHWFILLIKSYDVIVVIELMQATMENIILAKGNYVDLLINDQVIGLARDESTKSGTYHVGERVDNLCHSTTFD